MTEQQIRKEIIQSIETYVIMNPQLSIEESRGILGVVDLLKERRL